MAAAKTVLKSISTAIAVNDDDFGSTVRQLRQLWVNATSDEKAFDREVRFTYPKPDSIEDFSIFICGFRMRRVLNPTQTPAGPRLGFSWVVDMQGQNPGEFLQPARVRLAKGLMQALKNATPPGLTLKYQADLAQFPKIFVYATITG